MTNPVKNNLSKGILFIIGGAASYGSLSSLVKLAYAQGYSTAEVTMSQYLFGIIVLLVLNARAKVNPQIRSGDYSKLLAAGLCFGLTSIFYYLSVNYIMASIAVVLLMQSVWIGVLIEAIRTRKFPNAKKIIAVLIVLTGTVFATNVINMDSATIDFRGLIFGFLAAISFSLVLLSTNTVATYLSPAKRSLYMLYGGSIIVLIFAFLTQIAPYYWNLQVLPDSFISYKPVDFSIFYTWGFALSIFGTVLPPLLFNQGFPLTGVGLGAILSAAELPVSIIVAYTLLGEIIIPTQWLGVCLILGAIVLLNIKTKQGLKTLFKKSG